MRFIIIHHFPGFVQELSWVSQSADGMRGTSKVGAPWHIAEASAESLSGSAIDQLLHTGPPSIYGADVTIMDMREMIKPSRDQILLHGCDTGSKGMMAFRSLEQAAEEWLLRAGWGIHGPNLGSWMIMDASTPGV